MNIGKGGQIATNQYVCGDCHAPWIPSWANRCPTCKSEHRVFSHQGTGDIPITLPPGHVRITSIDLPWGDVFAIAFKFCVVLAVFQAVFLIVAVLLWR
jgi:hypothetical protein